jgi:hypothetical protein
MCFTKDHNLFLEKKTGKDKIIVSPFIFSYDFLKSFLAVSEPSALHLREWNTKDVYWVQRGKCINRAAYTLTIN